MNRIALFAALAVLSACATSLPQIVPGEADTFSVRFASGVTTNQEADAVANAHCSNGAAGFVSQDTRFDGLAYRTYRCARR